MQSQKKKVCFNKTMSMILESFIMYIYINSNEIINYHIIHWSINDNLSRRIKRLTKDKYGECVQPRNTPPQTHSIIPGSF